MEKNLSKNNSNETLSLDWDYYTQLRRGLHRYPEISEFEFETASSIKMNLGYSEPDEILDGLGHMGTGLCAVYKGEEPGPTIILRCELDALAIIEENKFDHKSCKEGVSHMCGHDGHMATMLAVADSLKKNKIKRGRAVLLFQPAEETGTGALALLSDPRFLSLHPEYIFSFHNIPKAPKSRVLIRKGTFALGSIGFMISIKGRTSHSSYPEHGLNPTLAVSSLMRFVNKTGSSEGIDMGQKDFNDRVMAVITSVELGNVELGPNFGTTPGSAVVMGVLRAGDQKDMERLKGLLVEKVKELSKEDQLEYEVSWKEEFAVTKNHDDPTNRLIEVCQANGFDYEILEEPLRWSEDFGAYTQSFQGAFFGLGSGVDHPQLHNSNYDYPDDLIPVGTQVYRALLDSYLS